MAVNEKGYVRPTFDELLEARIEQAKELFGDDVDTENNSPLGKFIRLAVQDLADAYEAQEVIYYSRFPHTATGQSLDRLMPFANITRNPATRAEHEITFTGTANYEIPVGFLVSTSGEVEFYLVNAVMLDENGAGVGIVQCTELGTIGNVRLGEITEITNPDANVSEIQHTSIKLIADDEETDAELRARFDVALLGSGSGTAAAIRGAVMRVAGVNSCVVIENDSDVTDADGRPAHSFETYVFAPSTDNEDIAAAIFSKKPLGIFAHGTSNAVVVDVSGGRKVINFTRVEEIKVYIKITVATDASFEYDGIEQIKTALLTYVNGRLAGENVIYSKLFELAHKITGIIDVPSLTLSADGASYRVGNVVIDQNEVATLHADDIAVEVTMYEDI